jgi:hypothetical protein
MLHFAKGEIEVQNPAIPTKKEATFVYQKLLLFLSKPQAWLIIKGASPPLHLITLKRASTCGLMIYNTPC